MKYSKLHAEIPASGQCHEGGKQGGPVKMSGYRTKAWISGERRQTTVCYLELDLGLVSTWHRGHLSSCVYQHPHSESHTCKGADIRFLFPALLLELQPAHFRLPGKILPEGESDRLSPHVTLGAIIWRLALPIWAPSWDPPRERNHPLCGTDGSPIELADSFSSLIHVDLIILFTIEDG